MLDKIDPGHGGAAAARHARLAAERSFLVSGQHLSVSGGRL